ncbi:hypothetical protein RN001_014149 [Aquatica leii]|uniref:Uncharacterized protein n=1 Tax=Aquatica leii TaxID=1421715 RepID=A0AAN7PRG2_9COLE|nr:hypothetical protein RN001_014149 [Aquatica leii]
MLLFWAFSVEIPDVVFDKNAVKCLRKLGLSKEFVKEHYDEFYHLHKGNSDFDAYIECVVVGRKVFSRSGAMDEMKLPDDINTYIVPLLGLQNHKDKDVKVQEAIGRCKDVEGIHIGDRRIRMHNCIVDVLREL